MGCSTKISEQLTQAENQRNIISYETVGEGKAIVLIHAGGLDRKMWSKQLNSLKKDYKLIAYDLRGHGNTRMINDELFEIEDLNSVLRSEGVSKINLVGCSLGAIIALDYAIARPDVVEKLVLVSPGLIGFQEKDEAFLQLMTTYMEQIQQENKVGIIDNLKRLNAIGLKERTFEPEDEAYINNQLTAFVESGNYLRAPKIKLTNPIEHLRKLKTEVLILNGVYDFDYIKKNAAELKKHLPNATKVEVKEAGHLINLEQPTVFNSFLQGFIK